MKRFKNFVNRNKRYELKRQDGINVLVETENSKANTDKRRFFVNAIFSIISTIAAIVAAIFAALTYINS